MDNWKTIPGYSKYIINECGDIYSFFSDNILTPAINQDGYLRIMLKNNNNKRKTEFVHKLVLLTFIGPRPKGMICRHYPDQNPQNNHISNLSYSNQQQNSYDRIENNTYTCAILTPNMVIHIKEMLQNHATDKQIQEIYDISSAVLSNIRHNNIWKNIGIDISNIEYRRGGGQKLTIDEVKIIKTLLKEGKLSQQKIANKFGIDQSAVSNIKNNKSYRDVKL